MGGEQKIWEEFGYETAGAMELLVPSKSSSFHKRLTSPITKYAHTLSFNFKLTPPPHLSLSSSPTLFSHKTKTKTKTVPLYPSSSSSSSSSSKLSFSSDYHGLVVFSTSPSLVSAPSYTHHWIVVMGRPPFDNISSKPQVIDHYVNTLAQVLGSEKEAQMCIYHASWENQFGFCCDIDESASRQLASLPGVLSVQPDFDFQSDRKNYSLSGTSSGCVYQFNRETSRIFPEDTSKYWVVRLDKPPVEVVTKAQVVDYYSQILTKVLRNEKDAQMCIYHVSWQNQNQFGFCCEIDDECAQVLTGVPGVLSVQPDANFESDSKDYGGENKVLSSTDSSDSPGGTMNIKTKRLFVTGLSFYTSEKTLRAAFEGFGELVEVKIIMDKISKRSKGYAFLEYTTEEAAAAALKEMNSKIINGWMIIVDVAKSNPPRYNWGQSRPRV